MAERLLEMFMHRDSTPHEVAAPWRRADVQRAPAELHRLGLADGALVLNRQDAVQVARRGHDRRPRLGRGHRKAGLEAGVRPRRRHACGPRPCTVP